MGKLTLGILPKAHNEKTNLSTFCKLKADPIHTEFNWVESVNGDIISSENASWSVWFVRSNFKMSWHEGVEFCDSKGLNMARIYNMEENDAVYRMHKRQPVFAGLHLGARAPEGVSRTTSTSDYAK